MNLKILCFTNAHFIFLKTRSIWHDGQGGVEWIAGLHPENWVKKSDDLSIHQREVLLLNTTNLMKKAVNNLQNTFWFGLLEDQTKSFKMLSKQLGLATEIKLLQRNRGKPVSTTERVRNYFKKLVPMDVWFYEHAEKLFESRWIEIMSGGHELLQENPRHTTISLELPKISCMSTRFAMKCKNPSFYHRLQRNLEIYSPLLLDDF